MCHRGRLATLPSVSLMNDRERLESMYDAHAHRVYAYALRHRGPSEVDDIVSETFAAAWRRIDAVPADPLPWLLVTAGNVIRNQRRAEVRRANLHAVLSLGHESAVEAVDGVVTDRAQLVAALERLTDLEREALLLIAWDGLDLRGAANVARCAPRAFRARLTRARARLAAELGSHASVTVPTTEEIRP
jgi:RNA polymerase sigma factor (sigma-70 family)